MLTFYLLYNDIMAATTVIKSAVVANILCSDYFCFYAFYIINTLPTLKGNQILIGKQNPIFVL